MEAWYPGSRGGEAIANVLFGAVNPSGRLPITFPASTAQLPRPDLPGRNIGWNTTFKVDYREGAVVGYKWFEQQQTQPLYPFGFGLSYTQFRYSDLRITGDKTITASFTVTNTGKRPGADVPQLYATVLGKDGAHRRLIGWSKIALAPGESKHVHVAADPRLLAHFEEAQRGWRIAAGDYRIELGASSSDLKLTATAKLDERMLPP
jgi:beta-glucosidase